LAEEKSAQNAKNSRDNAEKALKAGKLELDEAATEAEKTRATAKVTQLESQLKIRTEAFENDCHRRRLKEGLGSSCQKEQRDEG